MDPQLRSILEVSRAIFESGPPLRLAMLFGSAARSRLRPESDVDLAILPRDPDLPLAEELELERRLEAALGRPVDFVRLDRASTLLRWEVARRGIAVLAGPGERTRFLVDAAAEYGDFAPDLERAARRFQDRLIGAGPRE